MLLLHPTARYASKLVKGCAFGAPDSMDRRGNTFLDNSD